MYRVIVLYEQEPDAGAYEGHVDVCRLVPGGEFRHGKVFGSPMGEPQYAYYAEWEFSGRGDVPGRDDQRRVHGKRQGRARSRPARGRSELLADVS